MQIKIRITKIIFYALNNILKEKVIEEEVNDRENLTYTVCVEFKEKINRLLEWYATKY